MKKLTLSLLVAGLLAGCTTANKPEIWHNLGSNSVSNPATLNSDKALAVFYRDASVTQDVNIYIDRNYQASLIKQGFSEFEVCANQSLFSVSRVKDLLSDNRGNGEYFTLTPQTTAYFKVVQTQNGSVELVPVAADVAKQEMAGLRKTEHTLSRASDKCQNKPIQKTFAAGALFGLNKSDINSISASGQQEIRDFAKAIHGLAIKKVSVNGYTDPIGSDAYNLALSQRRADSVAQMLKNNGITAPIEAKGHGETNLVVNNCQNSGNKQAVTACNAPNRRVEISVISK